MKKCLFYILFLLATVFFHPGAVFSQAASCPTNDDACNKIKDPDSKATCFSNLVTACKNQANSLSSQVTYLNGQISLNELNIDKTELRIAELEAEIATISGKIERLEGSLTTVINVLISRVIATYKTGRGENLSLLLSSNGMSEFLSRAKYIKVAQEHDKKLLFQMQETKNNYLEQKAQREKKKKEQDELKIYLEGQKVQLANTKKQKESLISVTKNNQARFEQLRDEARKEAEQVRRAAAFVATSGEKKEVKRGDPIGLMGNTGFSTGAHLHLGIYNLKEDEFSSFNFNGSTSNPFDFLSSQSVNFEGTSCDDVSSSQSKTVGGGGWSWPMNSPTISQCYGHTPWSWRYSIGVHNGVDMWNNSDIVIRAVEDGNAYFYRGGQANGNGVFIFHNNGKMSLYWHLQ